MAADYSTRLQRAGAHCFDQELLASIAASVAKFLEKAPKVSIRLADEHTIEDSDLTMLMSDPYVRSKQIEKITLEGASGRILDKLAAGQQARFVTIELPGNMTASPSIYLSIRGDREGCILLRTELEILIKGAELWYSPLYPSKDIFKFAIFAFGAAVAFLGGAFLISLTGLDPKNSWIPTLLGVAMISVFGLELYLKKKLFPNFLFDIGYSERQSQQAKSFRKFVFGTVIVGVIIKLAVDRFLH